MGNSSRKQACRSIGCCFSSGTSASTQQAVPQPSSGTPGSSTNRPSQENTPSSSKTAITNLVQQLQARPTDVTKFEAILKFIDEALEKRQDHSKYDLEISSLIQASFEDGAKTLSWVSGLYQDKDGTRSEVELHKILSDAFGALGSVHRITAGFSVVASVLNRIWNMRENKESCLHVLEQVRDLGHHLVKLFDRIPNECQKFWKAGSVIMEAAIFCIKQLDANYCKRFAFAKVTTSDISSFKEKLSGLYEDLGLTLSVQILDSIPKPAPPYRPENRSSIVGREEIMDHVLGVMQFEPQTCQAILLHGLGGIGKTTIGDQIVAKSRQRFGIVEKVEIGEEPSPGEIMRCQQKIIETLDCKRDVGDVSRGQDLLCECFKKCVGPILLFIDNVFRHDDLEKLLPETLSSDLPIGSYILVTSRSEEVSAAFSCSGVEWMNCFVDVLKESDACFLFENHLGGCPEDKREQFSEVLGLCGGWPLAIEVVGSHLRKRKEKDSMWTAAISQLSRCKSVSHNAKDRLRKILDWSYEQLDEGAQDVFLDISCLLIGAEWNWCEALGAGSELNALEARSLFKRAERIGDYYYRSSYDSVGAHDLVIALGRRKEEDMSGGLRRRVYSSGIFGDDMNVEHVQGLVLELADIDTVQAKTLDAMSKSLRILRLEPLIWVEGQCQQIPRKLQICSMGRFPFRGMDGLDDLRVLHIHRQGWWRMPKETELSEISVLPKSLRVLHLENIASLETFHPEAFQGCDSLQTVIIIDCENLKELPSSICGIRTMHELYLCRNGRLKTFPSGLNLLQSLETFSFIGQLDEFPAGLASLQKLRKMTLCYHERYKSFRDYFAESVEMERRLHDIGELCALQTLRLEGWRSLRRLCDDFSKLTALKELSLRKCESLTQLPEGIENLHALSSLDLGGCSSLENLPKGFSQLSSLEKLDLQGCSSLENLPKGFSQLSSLEKLHLDRCTSLRQIPGGLENLPRLSTMSMSGMDNLKLFPDNFPWPRSLQDLSIDSRVVASCDISAWQSLERIELTDCKTMTQLPAGLESLSALRTFEISDCPILSELPSGFGKLVSLKSLTINGCLSLRKLPDNIGGLVALERICLYRCKDLQSVPDSICELKGLKSLCIFGGRFAKLPENLGDISALKSLDLPGCRDLETLPSSIIRLKHLKTLYISGVTGLNKTETTRWLAQHGVEVMYYPF